MGVKKKEKKKQRPKIIFEKKTTTKNQMIQLVQTRTIHSSSNIHNSMMLNITTTTTRTTILLLIQIVVLLCFVQNVHGFSSIQPPPSPTTQSKISTTIIGLSEEQRQLLIETANTIPNSNYQGWSNRAGKVITPIYVDNVDISNNNPTNNV